MKEKAAYTEIFAERQVIHSDVSIDELPFPEFDEALAEQQRRGRRHISHPSCQMQRLRLAVVLRVDRCASAHERLDSVQLAMIDCPMQRCCAVAIACLDGRASLHQSADDLRVAQHSSDVQRCGLVVVARFKRRARFRELSHRCHVTPFHGLVEWRPKPILRTAGGRQEACRKQQHRKTDFLISSRRRAEQQLELPLNSYISNNRSSDNRMQRPERELGGWARSQGEIWQSKPAPPGAHYALERHGRLALKVNKKYSKLFTPEESGEKATGSQECQRNPGTANSLVRMGVEI